MSNTTTLEGEWVTSVRIATPEALGKKSYRFIDYFQLDSHLSERAGDFDYAFFENSKRRSDMPPAIRYIDLPGQYARTFLDMIGDVDEYAARIPIEVVGWLKNLQLTGTERGNLLTNSCPNLFVCRAEVDDELRFVDLNHTKKSNWRISSRKFRTHEMITGPCRIFVACRDR